jgi:organic hydroperoxide reductase OsmC/OhrA
VSRLVTTHTYTSALTWRGTTAVGYEEYDRIHRVTVPPAGGELLLSSDTAFLGNAELANPEQLLLAAASSCQLLSFLAAAARSRVDVLEYDDEAEAVMPEGKRMSITRIVLRPRIVVAAGTNLDRVRRLVELGHEQCFIANSLKSEMVVEPSIEERY